QVSTIVVGLSHSWSLAFLTDGDILITERGGRLRRVHNGVLRLARIAGTPKVHETSQEGLLDVALHPRFGENHLVYLTYSKAGGRGSTAVLARGRLDGDTLSGLAWICRCRRRARSRCSRESAIVFATSVRAPTVCCICSLTTGTTACFA